MKGNAWFIFLATAVLESGIIVVGGWTLWISLSPEERAQVAGFWVAHAGMPILTGLFLLLLLGLGVNLIFRWYINPLKAVAEEIRIIAMSNSGHRLVLDGRPELQDMITSVNLLAEHHQQSQDDVQAQIRVANSALEEERSTLAALMSKLTQGVLVCNEEGKILLYNQRAQRLLEDANQPAVGWIGLGRPIHGVLDQSLINHALLHIEHRLAQGDSNPSAPFVTSRAGGRLLSVHLVPVLDKYKNRTGYILTLEDITQHAEIENRMGTLLRSLTEGQRSSIAGIRAAIEMILQYPDMDQERLQQFHTIVRDETVKLSERLDETVAEYSDDLKVQWPLEEGTANDLLAAIERRFQDTFANPIAIDALQEPLRLKMDSYALIQAMLFVVEQLLEVCQAQHMRLQLKPQFPFACFMLSWHGQALDMATFRAWGKRPLLADQQGVAVTLQDVVEHHGGAVWTQIETEPGRNAVRLLLPALAGGKEEIDQPQGEDGGEDQHYYDFHLFHRPEQHSALDDCLLSELHYTVIDTETTGLNPSEGDEIIAIGAMRIVNERILKREAFDCLVNPRRPISEAAMAIHGFSNNQLKDKPILDDVLPRFHRFVEDTVIVGHNLAFDMRFFELKEAKTGIRFTNPALDTLLLTYVVHPNQEDNSLEAIAARFGVKVSGRHTAMGDTLTTAQIFVALIPLLAERGIRTLGQASAACKNIEQARISY
ncbi:MAG: exonuclease domain-containing protein [Candidatus Competibacteraceae bacterium]|nr:exonuclease domain-containing protein [Candidatus Competibacteraceae bacterium]